MSLNEENLIEIKTALHILKVYQGKDKYWKKVLGEETNVPFFYNSLTDEMQFELPSGYVDTMKEPQQSIAESEIIL